MSAIGRLLTTRGSAPQAIAFINRLSDCFFIFSRWVSCTMGEEEVLWDPGSSVNKDWKWE
jgi:cob(I)alamin adenosyltransferase